MKRVLVISTCPHVRSNSDTLVDKFIRGAKEAGLQKAYEMGKNC